MEHYQSWMFACLNKLLRVLLIFPSKIKRNEGWFYTFFFFFFYIWKEKQNSTTLYVHGVISYENITRLIFLFSFFFYLWLCCVIFGVVFSVFFFSLLSQSLDKQRVVEEPVYILKVLTHTDTVVHVHRHVTHAHKDICATLWTQWWWPLLMWY